MNSCCSLLSWTVPNWSFCWWRWWLWTFHKRGERFSTEIPSCNWNVLLSVPRNRLRPHAESWSDSGIRISCHDCTYLKKNSIENHITTIISITNNIAMACSSYSAIVEKTLKARHVNTIKNLQEIKMRTKCYYNEYLMFVVNKFMKIHIVFFSQHSEILNSSDGNPFFFRQRDLRLSKW